jgi:hypothetical protein
MDVKDVVAEGQAKEQRGELLDVEEEKLGAMEDLEDCLAKPFGK